MSHASPDGDGSLRQSERPVHTAFSRRVQFSLRWLGAKMTDGAQFMVRYRMQRSDYVALTTTLSRRPLGRALLDTLLFFVVVLLALILLLGGLDGAWRGLVAIATLEAPLWVYPLLLLGPALSLLHPWVMGLTAALIYRRNAIAEREVTLEFDGAGVQGGTAGLFSRIGWSAVRRVIETPRHLFIAISRREALIVPRRAFRHDDEYRTLAGFVRARIAASHRH